MVGWNEGCSPTHSSWATVTLFRQHNLGSREGKEQSAAVRVHWEEHFTRVPCSLVLHFTKHINSSLCVQPCVPQVNTSSLTHSLSSAARISWGLPAFLPGCWEQYSGKAPVPGAEDLNSTLDSPAPHPGLQPSEGHHQYSSPTSISRATCSAGQKFGEGGKRLAHRCFSGHRHL